MGRTVPLGNNATTATSYAFVVNAQDPSSGLFVTDGSPINLQLVGGVVVGVVSAGAFNGQAAFAISIDHTTGVATVEQYLSLQHPINPDPNDVVFLKDGSLSVQVTITDGDGDQASNSADVSHQISFADDGPTLAVTAPAAINGLDFGNFALNNNAWGTGSGVATGTNGGWTIANATDGQGGKAVARSARARRRRL